MALVGATIVGSIATAWHGVVNPPRAGVLRDWRYDDRAIITLRRGEEMGRFLLGSTVILLFPRDVLRLHADWVPGRTVRMGEAMADALARARRAGGTSPSERGSGLIPLDGIESGAHCIVREMGGGAPFQDRLAGMGLTRGTPIEMLQNSAHGPVLVRAHAARIALGRGEAAKVLVEPTDEPPSAP